MSDHPFVARIRAEREILKAVNEKGGVRCPPLAGLSRHAIRRWIAESATPISDDLVALLLRTSEQLRLGSTASHRGALVSAAPEDRETGAAISEIRCLLYGATGE